MKTSSLALVLILLPQFLFALTLEQIQQAALLSRPLIKQYQVSIEQSAENVRIARSGYYPSVGLGYRAWALDEASTSEERENSAVYGSLSWNLFSRLQRHIHGRFY